MRPASLEAGQVTGTRRRVVITGIGMVSARGNSFADTVSSIGRGERAFGPITSLDAAGFSADRGAEVSGFDPRPHFRVPKALKLTDRTTQFAVAAAAMALELAGWPKDDTWSDRLGVLIGVSGSDLQVQDLAGALRSDGAPVPVADIPVFADRILSGLNPLWLLVNLPNMPSAHVAIQLGARGPNSTVMTDWVAGSQAIGEAADWIRAGDTEAVLAGGADNAMQPFALNAYDQAGLLTLSAGGQPAFVPGEGAAVLLLEERSHALARGATVLGEVAGYASASSPAGSSPHALARTMSSALRDARWTTSDVAAVAMASREGSSLRADEDVALDDALGADAAGVERLDYQPAVGHALAAQGPISLCLALAGSTDSRGLVCNATGYSGQAVTIAVVPRGGTVGMEP
jgi:3-oxoacyl-[acyl-carrier-protein] synthase II